MFDTLSDKLQGVLSDVRSRGKLSEDDVNKAMREIRLALLEADVNFKVVKQFTATVKERALGQEVLDSLNPGQQVVKIVNEELTTLMGESSRQITFAPKPPTVILMAGLQGSGKTTACGKLARLLQGGGQGRGAGGLRRLPPGGRRAAREGRRSRPARPFTSRAPTATRATSPSGRSTRPGATGRDVLIVDTSGRLHIDEDLMKELADIKKRVRPHNVLLVVDAMTGQDAVNVAEQFAETAQFDGVVMTKLDGDARGGAALSIKAVTGKPILYASTGEKLAEFEPFHPDRMASRILGMGDVLSFIEKAEKAVDADQAEELERKIRKQEFGFDDFLDQMKQIRRMGPIGNMLGMLPGFGQLKQLKKAKVDERELDRLEAIVTSMTLAGAPQPADHQRLAPQADRNGLGHHRAGREPADQAVRPDAEDDALAPAGQDALDGPADARRQVGRPGFPLSFRRPERERFHLAVRIRLTRVGARNNPIWRVVAADQRSPRDGRFIEVLGHYNPQTEPSTIELDEEASAGGSQGRAAVRDRQEAAEGKGDHRLKELLEFLAKTLVDNPDQVEVREYRGGRRHDRVRADRGRGGPRQGDRPQGPHRQGAALDHEGRRHQRRKAGARRDRRLGRPLRGYATFV